MRGTGMLRRAYLCWPAGKEVFLELEVVDCVEREHEKSDIPLAEFVAERLFRHSCTTGRTLGKGRARVNVRSMWLPSSRTHRSCRHSASRANPWRVWSGCGTPASLAAAQDPALKPAGEPEGAVAGALALGQPASAAAALSQPHPSG